MANNISEDNKRIAKNTILLYIRMGIGMIVGLYTSRILLKTLGVEDFGVNNVVGGFVGFFSLISQSTTSTISRFLTFQLGKKDIFQLQRVFSASFIIQAVLSLIVVLACETIGLWFLNNNLVIPDDRMVAANWVFQLSIISFALGLMNSPYNAILVAHEKMSIYAYLGLLQIFVNLGITLAIAYSQSDRLVLYSLLCTLYGLLNQIYLWIYCKRNFEECNVKFKRIERNLFRQMFSFAGWNFIGSASAILRDQGGNVLLNIYFGPVVNASRGIAMTVNGKVSQFIGNFTVAVNPQITKKYAAGEFEDMLKLVYRSSIYSYYLFFLLALPIILNIDIILDIWLYEVPKHTNTFSVLVMVFSLIETISNPLLIAAKATGNIKYYQITVGGIQMLNFPLSLSLLYLGFPPETIFIVAIICSICCLFARLVILERMLPFDSLDYFKNVILKLLIVTTIGFIPPFIISLFQYNSVWLHLLITTLISIIWVIIVILYFGCLPKERVFLFDKLKSAQNKLLHSK